ncbi:S-layer homology domain-containing protein, partial [Paenibacillus maysiensis]|uniref:S-layer homology domain-containing protein n=1 Tax=Paenibacillus maysiensis TaxID=1155954 RepID=UPI00046FC917
LTAAAQAELADQAEVSAWASAAVQKGINNGLFTGHGSGRFIPLEFMNRAECAQVISKLVE